MNLVNDLQNKFDGDFYRKQSCYCNFVKYWEFELKIEYFKGKFKEFIGY